MSIWQTALGMNLHNNPIVDSPFVDQMNIDGTSFPAQEGILTEGGSFILTEGGDYLITE